MKAPTPGRREWTTTIDQKRTLARRTHPQRHYKTGKRPIAEEEYDYMAVYQDLDEDEPEKDNPHPDQQ